MRSLNLRHHPGVGNPLMTLQERPEGRALLLGSLDTLQNDIVIIDVVGIQLEVGTEPYKNISQTGVGGIPFCHPVLQICQHLTEINTNN